MFVVGPRDSEEGTVSVRDRIEGDLGAMSVEKAVAKLQHEIQVKTVRRSFSGSAGLGEQGRSNEY